MNLDKGKIEWVGEVLAKVGYGILTRELLLPIVDQIKLVPKEDYVKPEDKYIDGIWAEKVIESLMKPESDIRVNFCIPTLYEYIPGKFNIGMSLWDVDPLPQEWVTRMNNMDAILFLNNDMAMTASKSGVRKPIAVFSPYVNLDRWSNTTDKIKLETDTDIVYFVDESWGPNSNLEELVTAYCIAFDGVKNTTLAIRIDNAGSVDQKKSVRGSIHAIINRLNGLNRPKVLVLDDDMSEAEMNSLINSSTYYISARSSTAFDMQIIRAAAIGVPIIGTNLPNRDNSLLSFKINTYSVPMLVPAPFYKYNQYCKKPDIRDFVEKLRYSYNLFLSDKAGYSRLIQTKKEEAGKKYGSTNLLEVCDHLYKEFVKENERKKHGPPIIGMV